MITSLLQLIIDIDECALNSTNPCEQICTNGEGNFSCSCRNGFSQNGFSCDGMLLIWQKKVY